METVEFLLKFCLILLSAKVLAEGFSFAGLPAVIGEVFAGIIIGPSILGLIGAQDVFVLLANIGLLFLLFNVGIETDVRRLFSVGGQSALVAVTGVALPLVIGYAASRYFFGLPGIVSMFIGGTLVATSIGITVRVLRDLGLQRTHVAQVVLGAAIMDDVIGVAVLAVLMEYQSEGIQVLPSLRVLAFITLFLLAAPSLGPPLRKGLARLDSFAKTPGIVLIAVVSFLFITSAIAHKLGAPEIIGAFGAGIALAGEPLFGKKRERTEEGAASLEKVEKSIGPIGELFIPVFFVMVGVSIDLNQIDFGSSSFWTFAIVLTFIAFITKLASGVWVKGDIWVKASAGAAMVPRGEVGLVFALAGLKQGIFDAPMYASVVFVVAATTLLAPFLIKAAAKRHE